jgi:hypothetical protein
MKFPTLHISIKSLILSFFFVSYLSPFTQKLSKNLVYKTDDFSASCMGRYTQEYFGAQNTQFLNSAIPWDCTSYERSTIDFTIDALHGSVEQPRLLFHETFRVRHKWGFETDAKVGDSVAMVVDVPVPVKGKSADKHLIWSREAWVKMALGNLDYPNDNYLQVGLIPFEVGRGISLGAAYVVRGFLGFSPGDSIDQFAPAVRLSVNPIAERFVVDFYTAIVQNYTLGYRSNSALVRQGDLEASCLARGLPGQSYISAIRSIVKLLDGAKEKLSVEPYIVFLQGPDQALEFLIDAQSSLTTYGCAIEGVKGPLNFGFEGALNQGSQGLKPWDRNLIKLANNLSTGAVSEQYTKIYTQDPAITKNPTPAYVTTANSAAVKGSRKGSSFNGMEIAPGLWNAFDRFRPAQQFNLSGFFLMADASYECIEKVLVATLGAGYASGYIGPQLNTNLLTTDQLMNQQFTGFIPVQSVYSGKRLTQLVVFNKGIPRFNVKNPSAITINQNLNHVLQSDSIDEVTNIIFLGGAFDWSPQNWSDHKVKISPNVIAYWSPDVSNFVVKPAVLSPLSGAVVVPALLQPSSNALGIEVTTKLSADIYKEFNIYSYFGLFFPGQHYTDMCGTLIGGVPTGNSPAYILDVGMTYNW